MKNRKQFLTTVGLGIAGTVLGNNKFTNDNKDTPQLEFAFSAKVTLDKLQDLGNTPHGHRRIIPITGGSFEGPAIKGIVKPGGADWQIVRADGFTRAWASVKNASPNMFTLIAMGTGTAYFSSLAALFPLPAEVLKGLQ